MLTYDYAGYGIASQTPSEDASYHNLEVVLSYAIATLGYELSEIFLWGFSLGSGPTVEIATRYQSLAGVILHSPLASCLAWLDSSLDKCTQGYAGPDLFSNITKVAKIKSKVLILHGGEDRIIPSCHSQCLYNQLKKSRKLPTLDNSSDEWLIIVSGADHNDIPSVFENNSAPLKKKVKSIMDFMYVSRKVQLKRGPVNIAVVHKEEQLILKKHFESVRVNATGLWHKITPKKIQTIHKLSEDLAESTEESLNASPLKKMSL